jgi:hypothetical protein
VAEDYAHLPERLACLRAPHIILDLSQCSSPRKDVKIGSVGSDCIHIALTIVSRGTSIIKREAFRGLARTQPPTKPHQKTELGTCAREIFFSANTVRVIDDAVDLFMLRAR